MTTARPFSRCSRSSRARSGRSTSHGPHSGSLKTRSTRRPRLSASETVRPARSGSSKVGAGDTRLQPFPLDQALGERTLARKVPATTGGFLCELRNLTRADGDGLRDPAPVVEEVGHGRSHTCEPCDGPAVGLKEHGAVKTVLLQKRAVALGAAVADENELRLPSLQILLEAGEVGRDLPAEPALGAPVDEEDARLEVLEPDFLPSEIGQPEGREGRCEREAPAGWIAPGVSGALVGRSRASIRRSRRPCCCRTRTRSQASKTTASRRTPRSAHITMVIRTPPPPQVRAIRAH